MTTRTMPETHEERCRELAERRVPCPQCAMNTRGFEYTSVASRPCPTCGGYTDGTVLDPRFASLRGEVPDSYRVTGYRHPYLLRTDDNALLETVSACGYRNVYLSPSPDGSWTAVIDLMLASEITVFGGTPAEAISAAVWLAELGAS